MADTKLQVLIEAKDKMTQELEKMGGSMTKFGTAVKVTAAAATAALAAITTVTVLAVTEFAEFEKGMSNVKAITRGTGDDMKKLTTLAKEMGRTTAFTAKEASDAMTYLGMAGFSTQEIMESLRGTMNLAAASNIDLGRAADIASNVLTGFRLEAKETNRVVDILAATITSSNTDMEQLADAMKYFAPTAAAFGVEIEEASATIGLLGNAGIQGSLATRALGSSLARLTSPTKEMYFVMDQLNLEFFDTEGHFVGMAGMINKLETAFTGLTDKQKQAAITTLFGAEAIQEINVLLSAGSEQLVEYTQKLKDSGGVAQEMATTQLDNLAGKYTLLKSAVSGLLIEMGESPSSGLTGAMTILTDAINWMTDSIVDSGGVIQFFQDLILNFFNWLDEKTGIITILKKAFDDVATVFNERLRPELKKLWEALQPLMPFLKTLAEIFGIILYGAIILLIKLLEGSLIVVIEILRVSLEAINKILEIFKNWWDKIIDNLSKAIGLIDSLIEKIKQLNLLQGAKNLVSSLGFGGEKAAGGPVSGGKTYLVGENGPELFTPSNSGKIIPNYALGAGSINVYVTVQGNVATQEELADAVGEHLTKKIMMSSAVAG